METHPARVNGNGLNRPIDIEIYIEMDECHLNASILLTARLDAYLSDDTENGSEEATDLEMELLESLKNRSVFHYFTILHKIGYPIEKIHLLVERICRMIQTSSPPNLDLEPVSHSSSSDDTSEREREHEREHEGNSEFRRGDYQSSLLSDSGADAHENARKTETETESDKSR